MVDETNPFLKQENYFSGYNESVEKLKNNPEALQFEKLCYMTFETESGKELMQLLVERYLIPAFVHPSAPNLSHSSIYFEGFKQGLRLLRDGVKSHEQRIQAESVKQ